MGFLVLNAAYENCRIFCNFSEFVGKIGLHKLRLCSFELHIFKRQYLNDCEICVSSRLSEPYRNLSHSFVLCEHFIIRNQQQVNNSYTTSLLSKKHDYNIFIKYISEIVGWGVYTATIIPRNTDILVYFGEYINTAETIKRQLKYDSEGINYVLTIKEHTRPTQPPQQQHSVSNTTSTASDKKDITKEKTIINTNSLVSNDYHGNLRANSTKTDELNLNSSIHNDEDSYNTQSVVLRTNIDATHYGGIARFVNHSCDPNIEVYMHREQGELLGVPIMRTLRTIAPCEQLTFDYGGSDIIPNNTRTTKQQSADVSDKQFTIQSTVPLTVSNNGDGNGTEQTMKRQRIALEQNINDSIQFTEQTKNTSSNNSSKRSKCYCGAINCRGYLPSV